jgi:uncharacterized phage-associated protein
LREERAENEGHQGERAEPAGLDFCPGVQYSGDHLYIATEGPAVSQVFSLAKALVKLSLEGDESDPLTHFRLQKLLYYAQAWSLILRETELFQEEICAWKNGPVVEEVYRKLPDGRCAAYVPEDAFANAPDLDPEDAAFLKSFWETYSGYSASQLYRMTHSEMPWQKTWKDRPNGNAPIAVEDIEEYFSRQTVPASLAAYCHDLRRREAAAEKKLREIPPIDMDRFRASATSFTPAALRKAAGG